MRKFWLGYLISSFLGVLYFIFLYYGEQNEPPFSVQNIPLFIFSLLIANMIAFVVNKSDQLLNQLIPWKKSVPIRMLSGIVTNTLMVILIAFGISILILTFYNGESFEEIVNKYQQPAIKLVIIALISVIIYSIVYFALFSYNQYAVVQIDSVKLERRQLNLQFEALKSQLSPHYLFNCLNTISSLVYKDAGQAEVFIRRLAQTYKYILSTNNQRLVEVVKEVEFVKSYYYLLKVRYENSFDLEINLPEKIMFSKLPPLTLQILVENAVKHNVFSKENPLEVNIGTNDENMIEVSNTKTEKPADTSSFRVGLSNIKSRYKFFTESNIEIVDNDSFTVSLPILTDKELSKIAV